MDKEKLSRMLDRLLEMEKDGAGRRGHKDYDDREILLDEMQQMMGMGMTTVKDIIAKAKRITGRV